MTPDIIDIEHLVLIGVDVHRPDRLRAAVEAAMQRTLRELPAAAVARTPDAHDRVAAEVAGHVATAVGAREV